MEHFLLRLFFHAGSLDKFVRNLRFRLITISVIYGCELEVRVDPSIGLFFDVAFLSNILALLKLDFGNRIVA